MAYPEFHRDIVKALTKGKFLLRSTHGKLFLSIYDKKEWYEEFFKETFDFQLIVKNEYTYLFSEQSSESTSRDICVFIAVLSLELDKEEDKGNIDDIKYRYFTFDMIFRILEDSPFKRNFENQTACYKDLSSFLKTLNTRNIIQYTERDSDKFRFTKAIDVFFDFARHVAKERLQEEVN